MPGINYEFGYPEGMVSNWLLKGLYNNSALPNESSLTSQLTIAQSALPDIYLFTADSAIPLADAVRAFYITQGARIPKLGYIRADRMVSVGITLDQQRLQTERLAEEKERLHTTVQGLGRACIVEEYHQTGRTFAFASRILHELGVPRIIPIKGNWYSQVDADEVDLNEVTSIYKPFMWDIGRQAASMRH